MQGFAVDFDAAGGVIENNLILNKNDSNVMWNFKPLFYNPVMPWQYWNVTMNNNIAWNWTPLHASIEVWGRYNNLNLTNNVFHGMGPQVYFLQWNGWPDNVYTGFNLQNNNVDAGYTSQVGPNIDTWSQTQAWANGGLSSNIPSNYPNTQVSLENYAKSLGLNATGKALYDAIRNNEIGNWNTALTGPVINDYLRSGFNMKYVPQSCGGKIDPLKFGYNYYDPNCNASIGQLWVTLDGVSTMACDPTGRLSTPPEWFDPIYTYLPGVTACYYPNGTLVSPNQPYVPNGPGTSTGPSPGNNQINGVGVMYPIVLLVIMLVTLL